MRASDDKQSLSADSHLLFEPSKNLYYPHSVKTCANCGKRYSPNISTCPRCGTKEPEEPLKAFCVLCTKTGELSEILVEPPTGFDPNCLPPSSVVYQSLYTNSDGTNRIGYHRTCVRQLYADIGPLNCAVCGTTVRDKDDFLRRPWDRHWGDCPDCGEPHPIRSDICYYCRLVILLAYQEPVESGQGNIQETSRGLVRDEALVHEFCSWYDFLGGVWSPEDADQP